PLGVADVQAGRAGVGEHVEDVELRLVGRIRGAEGLVLQPVFLPPRLDGFRVVTRHGLPPASEKVPVRRTVFLILFGRAGAGRGSEGRSDYRRRRPCVDAPRSEGGRLAGIVRTLLKINDLPTNAGLAPQFIADPMIAPRPSAERPFRGGRPPAPP